MEENNSSHPLRPPPAVPKRPVERPPSPNTVDIEPQEELEKIADIVRNIIPFYLSFLGLSLSLLHLVGRVVVARGVVLTRGSSSKR